MFRNACTNIRESIYGVLCQSLLEGNQVNFGNGTAFMIAPGICATAAHVLHQQGDKSKPLHPKIEVVRSPDIGTPMSAARLIAEDLVRDLAFLEIMNPRSSTVIPLYQKQISKGISCGSLGFPLANIEVVNNLVNFNLVERFQGAYISAFQTYNYPTGLLSFYEIDSVMYGGSSGCPGFTLEEIAFGMEVATVSEGTATNNSSRLAISLMVPSMDIIAFARSQGIRGLKIV